MGGPSETFKQFTSLEHQPTTQPIQNAQEAYGATNERNVKSNAAQPPTPPIEADEDAIPATSEFANFGEEILTAPLPSKLIVARTMPATPAAIGNPATTAADAAPIPTIADAEAGTLLSTLAPVSVAATKGTNLKDSFAKSKILQSLAAGQDVAADTSIATPADAEAGTALTEVVPQNDNKVRGDSMSSTSSS